MTTSPGLLNGSGATVRRAVDLYDERRLRLIRTAEDARLESQYRPGWLECYGFDPATKAKIEALPPYVQEWAAREYAAQQLQNNMARLNGHERTAKTRGGNSITWRLVKATQPNYGGLLAAMRKEAGY